MKLVTRSQSFERHLRLGSAALNTTNSAKYAMKKLRASQPFNFFATSVVNWQLSAKSVPSPFVVKHLHRVGLVRSRLPNGRMLKLESRADDWVSNQVYWRGWLGYEPESVSVFFRLATRARITFDIGAYVGFYSLLAAHANSIGRVYAFEPMRSACERLRRNLELNQLSNLKVVESAVGNINGIAKFFTVATHLPCSSSLSYEFMRSSEGVYGTDVSVIRLDDFVQEHDLRGIDLVKIDTESTEPQVLRGMYTTLRREKPFILCEVLGRGSEGSLEEILYPLGYRYYHSTPDGPIERERIEGHPEWLNHLFTTLDSESVARL